MYEDPGEEFQEKEKSLWLRALSWKSCLLLSVMLIGVISTPIALFYRWYEDRPLAPEDGYVEEQTDDVINRIAFVTSDRELATISPDGEDLRQIAILPNRLAFPAWSPDGSLLAIAVGSAGRGSRSA